MTRLIVGPFNRVEGDLEVRLEVEDGRVAQAFVTAPLYRGFEPLLLGHVPGDALVIAPRICGICSVAQSSAVAAALRGLATTPPPENGRLAADIVLAAENAADHLTHFALFFMPDFARAVYADRPWHAEAVRRFSAMKGRSAASVATARAELLHVVGILAGKWPHSLALQPGGTTTPVDAGAKVRLLGKIAAFRRFLETQMFAAPLERIVGLDSAAALDAYAAEKGDHGDFPLFLAIADDLHLDQVGRGGGRYMSYGAFAGPTGPLFRAGVWQHGQVTALDLATIGEDVSHAWLRGAPAHPSRGATLPDADQPEGYSWCKAPRLDGHSVEVGAFARQLVDGQPLVRDLAGQGGDSVRGRVVARMVETARLVLAMHDWARALQPRAPFCVTAELRDGAAVGLVEAARGGLGHWLTVEGGRIAQYQIIAPTTWNFSPRDEGGGPGPLEQALVGTAVRPGEAVPVAVQHVVRSFDPCMACTVH